LNTYSLGVRKGGLRRVFRPLVPTHQTSLLHPTDLRPGSTSNIKHQTSNISEYPRRVSPHARSRPSSLHLAELIPKMSSFFPKASPRTINSNKDATPSRYLSSTCSSGRRTACYNLALASLRPTKPPCTHNMEQCFQRWPRQPLHRRIRLSTR
jgi:hypothetical protein